MRIKVKDIFAFIDEIIERKPLEDRISLEDKIDIVNYALANIRNDIVDFMDVPDFTDYEGRKYERYEKFDVSNLNCAFNYLSNYILKDLDIEGEKFPYFYFISILAGRKIEELDPECYRYELLPSDPFIEKTKEFSANVLFNESIEYLYEHSKELNALLTYETDAKDYELISKLLILADLYWNKLEEKYNLEFDKTILSEVKHILGKPIDIRKEIFSNITSYVEQFKKEETIEKYFNCEINYNKG